MTPQTTKNTTMLWLIAAVAALTFPCATPSNGEDTGANSTSVRPLAEPGQVESLSRMELENPAQTMTGIEVRHGANELIVRIAADGRIIHEETRLDQKRFVVDLIHVASAVRRPVVRVNHPYLRQVRLGSHTDRVRLVFDLGEASQYSVHEDGDHLLVKFSGAATGEAMISPVPRTDVSEIVNSEDRGTGQLRVSARVRTLAHRTSTPFRVRPIQMMTEPETAPRQLPKDDLVVGETRYVGRRISLDFQQADISNVLRLIAEVSGFNIVIGEGVKSKVTMKLVSVPWDQALDMILKMNGLGKIKQGNILWIDSLANIAKQEDEEARAKDAKTKSEDLVDRVFYIRNLQAQELLTALRQNLSPRGQMQISQGTNALVVRDTETKMNVLKQLIDGLDLQVPQVQIEARIVQADTVYARGLGVQWGIKNTNLSGTSFSNVGGLTGPFGQGGTPNDFIVNLPAQVPGLPAVPQLGYTFGKLIEGVGLDIRLSAGELLGLAKVIAAPKITTLDKREAKIAQGESIPFQTTSLQGTQTTFVDANLELNVTPQITSRDPKELGKQIMMKVRATRNSVGARSNPAGPSIDRREATTQVIVRDGETMVIGGVFVDAQNNNVQGMPYLSRIPVLGWLFKNKSESVSKQELLIFLTPGIVKT